MSVLYVNDEPDRQEGHAHFYDEGREEVVAISFVADNGFAARFTFDPRTGRMRYAMYPYGENEIEAM